MTTTAPLKTKRGALHGAKARALSRDKTLVCERERDGTFSVDDVRGASTAMEAWLWWGDRHLGAEDAEGLAPN